MKLSNFSVISDNVDIDEYLAFTNLIKRDMADPNWLGDFDKTSIQNILNSRGKLWIYYDNDIPVCSMLLMMLDEDTLKSFELDFLDYRKCVDFGPMMVWDKYRGNNLQKQMFDVMNKYAFEKGYKYAICTIHPDNTYSRNNAEDYGFIKQSEKEFKRGKRIIYLKELDNK